MSSLFTEPILESYQPKATRLWEAPGEVRALEGNPGQQIIGPRIRLVNGGPSEASSPHSLVTQLPAFEFSQLRSQTNHPSCVLSEFLTHSSCEHNKVDTRQKVVQ